ncbi:prolyl oligopeptidase family serine peptidase [Streptomyces sp. NPDC005805]|uniref:prolyl oligopeptidase family serine peptidase n=1 Tax=Streptomyces sp. NPDC005805 TaxID=3157068 RepID=UPI0033EB708C
MTETGTHHPRYPAAPDRPVTDLLHGIPVPDPYRWLEDPTSPATAHWALRQQELSLRYLATRTDHSAAASLLARFALPTTTATRLHGRIRFTERTEPGQPHPSLHAGPHDRPPAEDRVLWSSTPLARWDPSPDGAKMACQAIVGGREDTTPLTVLGTTDPRTLFQAPLTRYSPVAWLPDSSGFYYVRPDAPGRPQRVRLHRDGTDRAVFGTPDPLDRYDVTLWHGRWLCIAVRHATGRGNEIWLADLRSQPPHRPDLRPLRQTRDHHHVPAVAEDGTVYLLVDPATARSHVVRLAPPAQPVGERAERIVLESDPSAPLTHAAVGRSDHDLATDVLLVARLRTGIPELHVHRADTGRPLRTLATPGTGTVQHLRWPPAAPRAEIGWTSWTVPPTTAHLDPLRDDLRVTHPAPGLEEQRTSATSADGTEVTVTLLRSNSAPAGARPALLLGYGGFGLTLTPSYESLVLAWTAAGGLVALPELREAGTELTKRPTLEDLEATADHLHRQGLSRPGQLALLGMSNGGLVMAAALARSPHRYAAAVCIAPLTDMIRYESSGLGPSWRAEYGTATDADQCVQLLSYSPYHALRDGGTYPPTLIAVMDGDTRVDPLHARKFCARLQQADPGGGPFLLRTYGDSGHVSMPPAVRRQMGADILAFLAAHTRLDLSAADEPS